MKKTNLFKRGMSMLTATALMAGLLVCGTAVQEPITVEAATTTKNIAAPIYSAVMDFEDVTTGTYTKAGTEEGVVGNTVTDGGLSLSVSEAQSAAPDPSVTVMADDTGKFGGSTVLKVNPFSSETDTGYRYAMLRPTELTVPGGTDKAFSTKAEDGTRLSRGYRLHYSYDYYIDGITTGFTAQDLRWMNGTTQVKSETLLNAKTTNLHNPNTTKVASGDGDKADADKKGTLNWTGSAWTQTNYPDAIHMDYIIDFETGEIWMYSDGELFACRDFSESPRSYYATAFQSLQDINNMMVQLRMRTASGETGVIYYDNFKIDMYGSDVSAKQLRELVGESTSGHEDSAITRHATADFDGASTVTSNMAISNSNATNATDNGRLKVSRSVTSNTADEYINMNMSVNYTYSQLVARSLDLPTLTSDSTTYYTGQSGTAAAKVNENSGIRYLRFGYDREATSSTAYKLHPVEYTDYLRFSVDVEPGTSSNEAPMWLGAYYYEFDGNGSPASDASLLAGSPGSYGPTFIRFTENAASGKYVTAFGKDIGVSWEKGKAYHVDYLVNLQDGTQIVMLDGKVIARYEVNTDGTGTITCSDGSTIADSTARYLAQKGAIPRFRAFFDESASCISEDDAFYLDNLEISVYNQLNTSFEALENELAYAATIEDLAGQLTDSGVNVTAKIGGNADKYSNAKIITALYQDYGEENAKLLDAAISDYEGEDDAFAVTLNAGDGTGTLLVKMFIWSMDELTPLCEAEESQAVAATVAAVYPNNTMKALTIGFDDCNDTANNYILSAMADYSQGLKKNCQPPLM